jgi:hypothetical protein
VTEEFPTKMSPTMTDEPVRFAIENKHLSVGIGLTDMEEQK